MKNTKAIIAVMSLSLLAAGCGEYSKSPVADLEQMRANGKSEQQAGPEKVRERIVEVKVKEDGTKVVVEQATIGVNSVTITPESNLSFSEGEKRSFSIRTKVFVPGIKMQLQFSNLPKGMTYEESAKEPGTYTISWAPEYYTVPAGQGMKIIEASVAPLFVSGDKDKLDALKALDFKKALTLYVFPTNQNPSEQKVVGLPQEVQEGSVSNFTVTVKVPGVDANSVEKPELLVYYDGQSITEGNNFLEMDGTRHVSLDVSKNSREYVGDYQWRFNRIFDTKNVNAAPQLGKDGKVIANYSGTRVRFTVKVIGGRGMSTPAQVVQVKISRNLPVEAPRFDLSALNAEVLEVARGQEISLSFNVVSGNTAAAVKMETAKTALPGSPKVNCQVSASGASTQSCVLTWKVPCDAQDDKLNGEVSMSAYSVLEGRNSQATAYSLKVVASKEDKKLCAEAPKTEESKATEAKATDAKATEVKSEEKRAQDAKSQDTKAKDTKAKDVKPKAVPTPTKKPTTEAKKPATTAKKTTTTTTKKTTDKKETK